MHNRGVVGYSKKSALLEEAITHMNAGKYGSLTKVSKATATRDLHTLLEIGALIHLGEGGGRSTKYKVNI